MDAERYVNDIVRKVKCTGARKKEIKNQLLSDIAARREQGESLEQIMESMGLAQEIAEAFCQNLSDADKKAYHRKRIALIAGVTAVAIAAVFVIIALYIWWILPKSVVLGDEYTEEEITARIEKVVGLLDQNDFETLQDISVDEMRAVLTQETMDKVRQDISDDWGSRQSIGHVYIQGVKQRGIFIIVTQTDVIYENISVVYTISFDEDLKLAGLYMR